jgi:undecaprenyl-diphosphatase
MIFHSKRRMSDWLAVCLLGLIEGVTEFLPISSTGHLLLVEHWLPRQPDLYNDLFNVVIQSGAVLAVALIFTGRVKQFLFQWNEPATRDYLAKLGGAFLITAVGGWVLKHYQYRLPETTAPVAWATLVGGAVLIGVESWLKGKSPHVEITWWVAVAAAIAQLVAAVFPGTSRSGATIVAALALGISRPAATEFSFLLGIPTLLAAGGVQLIGALQHPPATPVHWGLLCLGTVVSAVTAFGVVKWLLGFVQSHTFIGFGWYRIALGIMILVFAR